MLLLVQSLSPEFICAFHFSLQWRILVVPLLTLVALHSGCQSNWPIKFTPSCTTIKSYL